MDEYDSLHSNTSSRVRHASGVDCKIVVMGNSGVGKTSLLQRYTANKFTLHTTSTSGALFASKKVLIDGVKVRLQLWDTAGQERFRSMAPMYYRGANAALLLYDITDVSTFNDVKGWLEELRKNSAPDLLIYIVGSKSDLYDQRQVTPDLARLHLHNWFPPTSTPPPPQPTPAESKSSYIRPRFTSFPGLSSRNNTNPPTPTAGDSSPTGSSNASNKTSLDLVSSPNSTSTSFSSSTPRPSQIARSSTTVTARPRRTSAGPLTRSNTTGADSGGAAYKGHRHSQSIPALPKASSPSVGARLFGEVASGGWMWGGSTPAAADEENDSIEEEDEDGYGDEGRVRGKEGEWGLEKGMELFEVSAKDGVGIQNLFNHLLQTILLRLDKIEAENEIKKRDSVFLGSSNDLVAQPGWSAQADEEEQRLREEDESARTTRRGGGCCT